jgi:antitoxin component of MazEF toxin-antitoxin module
MIIDLIQDGDDVILPLPDEMLKALNVGVGDEIHFQSTDEGIIMSRKVPLKLYAVQTISIFRLVYFVSAENEDDAKKYVLSDNVEINSFQKHIGENVINVKEIDSIGMCNLIRETEFPNITQEEVNSGKWNKNINIVDYTS